MAKTRGPIDETVWSKQSILDFTNGVKIPRGGVAGGNPAAANPAAESFRYMAFYQSAGVTLSALAP